jgi:hypothetical protein
MWGKVKTVLFYLPIVLSIQGCKIFKTPKNLQPIEGNIVFSIKEGYEHPYSVGEPRIMLKMVTEKIYPCYNWTIDSDVGVRDKSINVTLNGIYVPEICFTALGPATFSSFLDLPNGDYVLTFTAGEIKDKYTLTVTDDYIKLNELSSHFTIPEFKLFWRYPPNSFAYLCGTTNETSWICEDFLDTLLSKIQLEEFYFPDSGEIPYPSSSMGHYYDMPARYFYYKNEADFDMAGEILRSYTQSVISQYSGVGISLINWKNKQYSSWLLGND